MVCAVHVCLQVVNPGKSLGPGQIYDSNRSTLLASLSEHGFPFSDLGIARDDRESLVKVIKQGLADNDVLVTSGGVSMGEKVSIWFRQCAHASDPFHVGFSVPTCNIEELGIGNEIT